MHKRYRVIGAHTVHGCPPGESFTADLESAHEQYLITAGHVEVVVDQGEQPGHNDNPDDQSA